MHSGIRWGNSSESIAWAIEVLADQAMPSKEIDAILWADDPELVRRYLDLHRERLEERLSEQRRTLARLEAVLTAGLFGAVARRREREVARR